jgi:hypothetical protein
MIEIDDKKQLLPDTVITSQLKRDFASRGSFNL